MDVELLRWPSERERRDRLRSSGKPHLLLVEGSAEPPSPGDPFEDWIRIPADRADVRLRIEGLIQRANGSVKAQIIIDGTGTLNHGSKRVPLPPMEARILDVLIEQMGQVVSRSDLAASAWPSGPPDRNVLDVHLVRLRRRIKEADLEIRTIRSRGLILERT
ncbi:MAG: winged helix-turn-helix domain-containing protein [Acidimicrobiia bacterium]|nr:winged helix-turn-helix domain-containing protein [Acidimicrobiia bacterium]MDH5504372.1 winged helix-turn-helix domain-containing protein [Acidimicrobiia bacterium]